MATLPPELSYLYNDNRVVDTGNEWRIFDKQTGNLVDVIDKGQATADGGYNPQEDEEPDDFPEEGDEEDETDGGEDESEDGYDHLDQSEETREREAMREDIRGDDLGPEDYAPEAADTAGAGGTGVGAAAGEAGELGAGAVGEVGGAAAEAGGGLIQELIALIAENPYVAGALAVLLVIVVVVALVVIGLASPKQAFPQTLGTPTVICLDPGHPSEVADGAAGPSGAEEKVINFQVATKLKAELTAKGYTVVMTKNSATEYKTNTDRANYCADQKAALMYRIHNNDAPGKKGIFHEYPNASRDSKISAQSKDYANKFQQEIVKNLGLKKTGPQPIDGGICEEGSGNGCSAPLIGSAAANTRGLPAIVVEMVALNDDGEKWITSDANQQKMAAGMAAAIEAAIPPTSSSSNAYGDKVTALAKTQLGKSYVWAACHDWTSTSNAPPDGCANYDCSGLVGWAWYWGSEKKFSPGGDTQALCQMKGGRAQIISDKGDIKNAQPGDILVWDYQGACSKPPIHHTALYIGNSQYIQAPSSGDVVKISHYPRSDGQTAIILRPIIK